MRRSSLMGIRASRKARENDRARIRKVVGSRDKAAGRTCGAHKTMGGASEAGRRGAERLGGRERKATGRTGRDKAPLLSRPPFGTCAAAVRRIPGKNRRHRH